ncbi:MAG: CHAT domain-containing protein, partial [Bryobacteraceae bacterium]
VDAAARSGLAREAFEAAEQNRARGLVEQRPEKTGWRLQLPPEYWRRAAELQAAEAALVAGGGESARREIRRLREQLLLAEAAADPGQGREPPLDPRAALDARTTLVSFHLGETRSYAWAMTRSSLRMEILPPRATIVAAARAFRESVEYGRPGADPLGAALYQMLFGALNPTGERWLLSLDEGLYEVPWVALHDGRAYLVESRTVQVVSGARHLGGERSPALQGPFVGVADAIYNRADPRSTGPAPAISLPRLPGSRREIQDCARLWKRDAILLEGVEARKERVRAVLDARPAVIHFATHVVRAPAPPSSALVALSGGEFLSPAEIRAWSAAGAVIVLSGCGSGAADTLPGAGLMGLTRAWLMAGARAVVASHWSTPDDSGALFLRFYEHLQAGSTGDPAGALRQAQRDLIASAGWRAQPRHWAAYFI